MRVPTGFVRSAAISAAMCFSSPIVLAQAAFTADSDVLGLTLGKTADEDIAYLKDHYEISAIKEDRTMPALGLMPGQKPPPENLLVAYEVDVTPKAEASANAAEADKDAQRLADAKKAGFNPISIVGDGPDAADSVKIIVSPNDPQQVLAIRRTRTYRRDDQPLIAVFTKAVEDKYGSPISTGNWQTVAGAGCLNTVCSHWASPVVPKKIDRGEDFTFYGCDKIIDGASQIEINFSGLETVVGWVRPGVPAHIDMTPCGIVLQVSANTGKSDEYVGKFKVMLADTPKIVAAIQKFDADRDDAAAKADKARLEQDAAKKPAL